MRYSRACVAVTLLVTSTAFAGALRLARGAAGSPPAATQPEATQPAATQPAPAQPPLTAEEAKQAVIDLIRKNPRRFAGNPDPDRLDKLPLKDQGNGRFRFGAIVVDPAGGWYDIWIGEEAADPYEYHGSISRQKDKWVASEPEARHFHRRL